MSKFLADDSNVRTVGRTVFLDGIRYLGWSGSAVEFMFTGTKAEAEIWTDWVCDAPWKEMFRPFMAIFADGETEPTARFPLSEGTNTYTLFESEFSETVKLRLVKLTEAAFNKTGIVSISADGRIRPAYPLSRKMEFIGDSITCGFGIEGKSPDETFSGATENPMKTYAVLTANSFGAEYSLISRTGIGVYSSDCDPNADKPADEWVMPKLYCRTDAGTEDAVGTGTLMWDFERYVPDVIVVNLGTNDSKFTRDIPERTEAFKKAYADFIRLVREKNPKAHIICVLGMMGAALGGKLFPQVEETVKELNDSRVYALELEEQQEGGIGCENHPNTVTHKKASEKLIGFISDITGWQSAK